MLLTLEELRQKAMVPAMAATGGDLAARVRRLLITPHSTPSSGGGTIMGMLVVAMSLVLMVTSLFASGPPEKAKATLVNSTTAHRDDDATPDADGDALPVARQNDSPAAEPNARQRSIQVLDENEEPVVGADVRLSFQQDGQVPSPKNWLIAAKTKEQGILTVEAPLESNKVYMTIVADGFSEFRDQRPAIGESKIRLKRGRIIRIRAFDQTGDLLRKSVPMLAGNHGHWGSEFTPQADGTVKSPPIELNRRLMRVVTATQNGLLLFSDLIDLETAQPGADGVIDVVLKSGVRITGKLDDSVPRPVGEGYVQLRVCEGPNHRLEMPTSEVSDRPASPWRNSWIWEDSAAVQPDGTFVFESVPSGGLAQIHAIVDGFMSANPPIDELSKLLRAHNAGDIKTSEALRKYLSGVNIWPQMVPVDSESVEVLVKCRPTASCNLRILDPSGKPVSGAAVSFHLNATTIFSGAFPPGLGSFNNSNLAEDILYDVSPFSTLKGEPSRTPRGTFRNKQKAWENRSYHEVLSDANGRAMIRNLPADCRLSFMVKAEGFLLPESPLYQPLSPRHYISKDVGYMDLLAGEISESTIYLERAEPEANYLEQDQPIASRKIMVVDHNGEPIEGVSVAVAEIRVGAKNWHKWSTQRFGAPQHATTDRSGRADLLIPGLIEGVVAERIRLAVNWRNEKAIVSGKLVEIPLKADGRVISVVPVQGQPQLFDVIYAQVR